MPTPEVHVSFMTSVLAVVYAVIAFMFEVSAPVVFAGFMGTLAGQAFSPATRYYNGLFIVLMGTCASAYATPMLIHKYGDFSARGIAFFTALIIVGFRKIIATAITDYIKSKGGGNAF